MKKCPNCNNPSAPDRRLCYPCKEINRRKKDYIKYLWFNLRNNAKRRGIYFDLSLRFFRLFCHYTGYHEKVGRRSEDLTIDRVDRNKGYEKNNLQVLTKHENCIKWHEVEVLEHYPF